MQYRIHLSCSHHPTFVTTRLASALGCQHLLASSAYSAGAHAGNSGRRPSCTTWWPSRPQSLVLGVPLSYHISTAIMSCTTHLVAAQQYVRQQSHITRSVCACTACTSHNVTPCTVTWWPSSMSGTSLKARPPVRISHRTRPKEYLDCMRRGRLGSETA